MPGARNGLETAKSEVERVRLGLDVGCRGLELDRGCSGLQWTGLGFKRAR